MVEIRVIVFKDSDQWVAQCLEYDIAAQAGDLDTLRSRLLVAIDAEALASEEIVGERFKGIPEAPKHFHRMWERKASSFRHTEARDGANVDMALAA